MTFGYLRVYISSIYKSTPQIVLDNFGQWLARIKIENDPESRWLSLDHTKNKLSEKVWIVKICACLTDLVKCLRMTSIISNLKVYHFADVFPMG